MKAFRSLMALWSLCLLLLITACHRLPPYKMTKQGDTFAEVELETRIPLEDLQGIAREVRPPGKGTADITFVLPSEYPGSEAPWAQVTFLRLSDTREQNQLTVNGACTDKHRDSLLGVKAGPGYQTVGKWHLRDPLTEAVLLIEQKDSVYTLQRHLAGKYLETDHEPLPVSGVWADDRGVNGMNAPAFIRNYAINVPVVRIDAQTYRSQEGGELMLYHIQPDGNLLLTDSLGKPSGTAVKVP